MKKRIALALCVLLVLSCTACGGKPSSSAPADSSTPSESSAPAENVTIEIWHPRGAGANGEMIASSVEEFNKTVGAEKGITVKEVSQGGYAEVVTATMNAVAAGTSPEIAVVENSTGTTTLSGEGILADIGALIERDGWDLENVQSGLLTYCYRDGKLIAMPYIRSTPVMYYNKTMTDALGVDIPIDGALSIEDFESLCKSLTKDGVYGFSLQNNTWYTQNFFYQLGSNMYDEAGTSCPALEDGVMLKVFTAWDGWIKDGWCQPFVSTNDEAYLEEQFSLGKIACIFDSTGKMGNIFGAVKDLGDPFEIGITFLPTFGEPSCPTGGGNMAIIEKGNSEADIDAAWEFMKFLLTPEQDALNHVNTGYVPSTKAAASAEIVQELWANEPYRQVGFNQLAYAQDAPSSDYGAEWGTAFGSVVSSMIQEGSISPEEAVEQLRTEAKNIFPG